MSTPAFQPGLRVELLIGVTTGTSVAYFCPPQIRQHTFIVRGIDTPSAGVVTMEASGDPAFAGTWSPIGSTITVPDGETVVTVAGLYPFIRARVTTPVTSGTVNVSYIGYKNN